MFSGSSFAGAAFAATGSNTFNVYVIESSQATDSARARATFVASVAETADAQDSVSVAGSVFNATVLASAAGEDTVSVTASTFNALVSETVEGSNIFTVGPSTFNATVAEQIEAHDVALTYVLFVCAIQEAGGIMDVTTARLLWEIIDDSQSAGWQTLNTAQSTTWSTINDSVPTTWSNIPTLD